jgi:hypothetical protein
VADDLVTQLRKLPYCGVDHCIEEREEAADEIERLRAVLDAIAAHVRRSIDGEPRSEYAAGYDEACIDVLAILPPMTLDEAINTLGTVHK